MSIIHKDTMSTQTQPWLTHSGARLVQTKQKLEQQQKHLLLSYRRLHLYSETVYKEKICVNSAQLEDICCL